MRISRLAVGLVGLGCLTMHPSPVLAGTAATCSRAGADLVVDIALETARIRIVRDGSNIKVIDRGVVLTCTGGTSTVTNTDGVDVSDDSSGSPHVTVSLMGGSFEPGASSTGEGAGLPEIEFTVEMGTGTLGDLFSVVGSAGADNIRLGLFGGGGDLLNLNGDDDGDDVALSNADKTIVRAGGGSDDVTGATGSEFDGPFVGRLKILGGTGADLLEGGSGRNTILGQDQPDLLFGRRSRDVISGGAGHDSARGGAAHDILTGQAGTDELRGDRGPDRLEGGTGDDGLLGGPGRDTCLGGPGQDVLSGCER